MIVFVALAAVKGLKKFNGNDKALFGALVSLWFAFQVQAQVSIDQITIAAIGWVLAGAVVALGFNSELIADKAFQPNTYAKKRRGSAANSTLLAGGLTLILVITSFAWLVPIWRADYNIKRAQFLLSNLDKIVQISETKDFAARAVSLSPREIEYKLIAADLLQSIQEYEPALQNLKDALRIDPKSYKALGYSAQVYERANLLDEAIKIRIISTKMDPNDTDNWLQLGKLLARLGDFQAVNKAIELVAPLAGKSTIADELKALLPSNFSN
jgi:tetratricopeptide (TPR) repeat protein